MTFTDYLKTKKNFLLFYFIVHSFALFVNIFLITGDINKHLNLFTTSGYNFLDGDKPSSHFWPIVEYSTDYSSNNWYFRGIFYNYDISEFLAYSVLIFIALYIYYENKPDNFKK